ncbi:MAG: hypothetical protein ABL893_11660 [Hyphomicrobium sp.]
MVCASAILAIIAAGSNAQAGNGANFVTYDHHTGKAGKTEIKLYSDVSRTAGDGERYTAQLLEYERSLTDQWVIAAYLESHDLNGDPWTADGFRLETRYRLFDYGTPFNPVVYLEYINKKEAALFLREATGRTDEHDGGEAEEHEDPDEREHELEAKLILGHDFSDRLRFGFNMIGEVNLKSGNWEFGYAAGFTYTLFERERAERSQQGGWNIKEVKLGAELFGGAGDSVKGLTLDSGKTEQYAGVALKTEFDNGAMLMIGGTFGLTDASEDALFRAAVGWEFD